MYKDQIKLVTEYYKETKDNDFIGNKYIAWLEKNLTESREQVKKLNIADVSNNEVAVCKNSDCESESIIEFIGRKKRQCQICGEFWKTDC